MKPKSAPTLATYVGTFFIPVVLAQAAQSAVTVGPESAQESSGTTSVVARVGDQPITFAEINTILNSSAVVGVSIPSVGTPARDTARLTILDKLISANLTYLDARAHKVDQDPSYLRDLQDFEQAILAGLYWQRQVVGGIRVESTEIEAFIARQAGVGTTVTEAERGAIESKLRRRKLDELRKEARAKIRDGIDLVIYSERLATSSESQLGDDTVVAEIAGNQLRWAEVQSQVQDASRGILAADPLVSRGEARAAALERVIDLHLMAERARDLGIDEDPVYRARVQEYRKSRLINLYRERLIDERMPTDAQLEAFYEANRGRFVEPEARRVQMVVLETKEQAIRLKTAMESGETTMHRVAQEHSIAANAKENLGEVGWVRAGETVPALDEVIFTTGPATIGGPVQTPAGWHLVKVLDLQKSRFDSFDDQATRRLVLREYLNDALDAYTRQLRRNTFSVEVDQEALVQLSQREADAVEALTEQAARPGSVTEQRLKQLGEALRP
jgi:peptidyl-prolyl cis-trans isomerase C